MLALLGSGALIHHTFTIRKPADCDLLGAYEEIQEHIRYVGKVEKIVANYPADSGRKIIVKTTEHIREYEVCWEGSDSEALLKLIVADKKSFLSDWDHGNCLVPDLDVLYMLKMSHRYKKDSPHFLKTMRDIQLMRKLGAKIRPEHEEWLKWREKETYQNSLPKLNKSKGEFFSGDGIVYEWDHDSLHEAIAYMDKPAYLYYSGGEVWSDMEKFKSLDKQIQLLGVLEECLVLAAERSQLAFTPAPDPRWSFEMALSKVCSSITSGYFRSFAYDHYDDVITMYDSFGYNYMEKVMKGIEDGIVKKVK